MATATINFPVMAASLPDGSASNLAPQMVRVKGSETAPAKHYVTANFDAASQENLWFNFQMPANYASAPIVRLHWTANATTGNVVWGARIGAVTPADADTPVEHALAAVTTATTGVNGTEARRLVETAITLANLDSAAIADEIFLQVYRDGANGSDTCSVDAELVSISLDYVTT